MTMPRFNIALLPLDPALQQAFADFAHRHFAGGEDQYILGPYALAHVTLCQFLASDEDEARTAFAAWPGKEVLTVSLAGLAIQAGTGEHAGKTWVNFPAMKTKELLDLQQSCFTHLRQAGFKVFNDPAIYFPHVTLARLRKPPPPSLLGQTAPAPDPLTVRPALGRSSEVGVFLAILA